MNTATGMLLKFSPDEVKEATKDYNKVRAAQTARAAASSAESTWGSFPRWT